MGPGRVVVQICRSRKQTNTVWQNIRPTMLTEIALTPARPPHARHPPGTTPPSFYIFKRPNGVSRLRLLTAPFLSVHGGSAS